MGDSRSKIPKYIEKFENSERLKRAQFLSSSGFRAPSAPSSGRGCKAYVYLPPIRTSQRTLCPAPASDAKALHVFLCVVLLKSSFSEDYLNKILGLGDKPTVGKYIPVSCHVFVCCP